MNLYLVKMSDTSSNEVFYKIGITQHTDSKKRFGYGSKKVVDSGLPLGEILTKVISGQKYISDHPYQVEVLHQVSYTYEWDAYLGEQEILRTLKPIQYWPSKNFPVKSECFATDKVNDLIIQCMNDDCNERNAAAPSELLYKVSGMKVKERDPIKRHLLILEKCRESRA
jgi:hypothetical protein